MYTFISRQLLEKAGLSTGTVGLSLSAENHGICALKIK
jgi:hypothetical protein